MTTKEAIRRIEEYAVYCPEMVPLPVAEALDIAVAALRAQQEAEKNEPLTNADCIRAMSDEALAEFLHVVYDENSLVKVDDIKNWLQKPAEGE